MQDAVYMLHVKEATVAWSVLTCVFWDVFVGVCVIKDGYLRGRLSLLSHAI